MGLTAIKPPPIKKLHLEVKHPAAITMHCCLEESSDEVTYKRHIEYMKKYPVDMSKVAAAVKRMNETRNGRTKWIKEVKPQVPVILSEFPYLRNIKVVSDQYN